MPNTLDKPAKDMIADFPLGFVATIDKSGHPRVSPKGTFVVLDNQTLGFSDIRSPATSANLAAQPACEVNFINPFTRKALRVSGAAQIFEKTSAEFAALLPHWQKLWPDLSHRINKIITIKLDKVQHITTPPYDDGLIESDMIETMKTKFARLYP